jgi:hypothetical protein
MIKVNNLDFSAIYIKFEFAVFFYEKRKRKSRQRKSKTTDSFGSFMSGIFLLRLYSFIHMFHENEERRKEIKKERNAAMIILIKFRRVALR